MAKFFLFAFFLSLSAPAAMLPIFNRDGTQATLMISAIGAPDPEAQHLFETLAVDRQEEQGKWTKKVKFIDKAGAQAFSVVCVLSKLAAGQSTCTLVMHAADGVTIHKEQKAFTYELLDSSEAAKMAAVFLPAPSGVIYRSANGRLEAIAERNELQQVIHFVLRYR